MEERENKTIGVVKTLFESMEQSLKSMEKENFEMHLAAVAEKAKTLARYIEEEIFCKKVK